MKVSSVGDLAVEELAAQRVVAEVCDRDDVDGAVQLRVAGLDEPMPDLGARGHYG